MKCIAVNLSRQKELDGDPKANQQIEFTEKFKKGDAENADGAKVMFGLIILEKIRKTGIKFSQRSLKVLQKIANFEEARVKLTHAQLNKPNKIRS